MNTKATSKILIVLLLFASFVACTPQKRLNRLISNHPELIKKDTVFICDTFYTQAVAIDTFATIVELNDTVNIYQDKVIIYKKHDTIFVRIRIPADIIVKRIFVPYNKVVVQPRTWWDKNKIWVIALSVLILLVVIFGILFSIYSKFVLNKIPAGK